MVTCWSYSLLGSTGDSASAEKNNNITGSPSCSVALFLVFFFASFSVGPAIFFLIRTISIPPRCLSSRPLSLFLLFHFRAFPSFSSFAYPSSLFVLIFHFLERFYFFLQISFRIF